MEKQDLMFMFTEIKKVFYINMLAESDKSLIKNQQKMI